MHTINNGNYIWKLARKKGITNYHNLSTDALIKLLCSAPFLYRKYINIVVENLGVNDPITKSTSYLVSIIEKYETSKKLTELGLNNSQKRNITKKDLSRIIELHELSHDDLDLEKIPKLRNIKNHDILAKERLIYTLLRLEKKSLWRKLWKIY